MCIEQLQADIEQECYKNVQENDKYVQNKMQIQADIEQECDKYGKICPEYIAAPG